MGPAGLNFCAADFLGGVLSIMPPVYFGTNARQKEGLA
jgi:hypothetical protein